ncbi:MAG: hypothetical protein O2854_04090 [Chloroflexi bacterium]|nr:hypothetical protein [Chloroflexota bacterium]
MSKKSVMSGKAMTVLGPVDPAVLGPTQTHEHLVIATDPYFVMPEEASLRALEHAPVTMDILGKLDSNWLHNRESQMLVDEQAALEEVMEFKLAGGGTIVDATSITIGRDPLALARISRASGLHVIMGGSYYVPVSYPTDMDTRPEDDIVEELVRDITVGVKNTGIKSGVIGEVGFVYPLTDTQKKVIRASARASVETGAPVLIHPGHHQRAPLEILEVMTKVGLDVESAIIGHLDMRISDNAILKELAQTGCFMEFDVFGNEKTGFGVHVKARGVPSDVQRMEMLEFVASEGHLGQVVVAQDHCLTWYWKRNGGHGYGHILESIAPRLKKRGFTQAQVDSILIDNPARALTFK